MTLWPRWSSRFLCCLTGYSSVVEQHTPPALPTTTVPSPRPAIPRDHPRWPNRLRRRRLTMNRGHCCWRISETGQCLGVTQILVGGVPTFWLLDSNCLLELEEKGLWQTDFGSQTYRSCVNRLSFNRLHSFVFGATVYCCVIVDLIVHLSCLCRVILC